MNCVFNSKMGRIIQEQGRLQLPAVCAGRAQVGIGKVAKLRGILA